MLGNLVCFLFGQRCESGTSSNFSSSVLTEQPQRVNECFLGSGLTIANRKPGSFWNPNGKRRLDANFVKSFSIVNIEEAEIVIHMQGHKGAL